MFELLDKFLVLSFAISMVAAVVVIVISKIVEGVKYVGKLFKPLKP